MATIYKRPLKNGKINYAIQIKVKGADGRSKFVCTTWKNENNLSGVRAEKAAERGGFDKKILLKEVWE